MPTSRDMDAAGKGTPKRKEKETRNDKRGSKAPKRKSNPNTHRKTQPGQAALSSDDEQDAIVNRRAKRPKMGRIGRTAGKNYPPEIQRALGRAHLLYVEGNVVEASQELSQVVVQCSSIPEPYALLALIYQDSGKYQEALVFYKLACARDPKKLGNHREAARIAGILGDHTSRLEALKVLARLQPNNLNVAIERARCLLELQKPKQALDVYAKAAKRFPRRLDIYLDLAEGVECISPQQHIFVHQALASCLRRAIGKKHLGPDVRDLADAFSSRLSEIKLERPKPKRLPARTPGLPSKRVAEVAMTAADLLVTKLMETRKRQEPQYEVAVQVVEGLVGWLDHCRTVADCESGEEADDDEELDSDSDLRDSNDEGSDDEEDDTELDREGSSAEEDLERDDMEADDDEPMDQFTLDPTTLLRYGICQLYCGDDKKATRAFAFLDNEEPEGPHGDMMMEIAKVYAETGHFAESLLYLRHVAQSMHIRHRLAGIQLGAAYASQRKHELAAEAYIAVLAERPHHAAALAGLAEAAYWRGKAAVPSALSALTPMVEMATKEWADDGGAPPPEDDDEGEVATGFQRLQLLMQWAILSRMADNTADFASVALPLVSVALGQLVQRQQYEAQKEPDVVVNADVREPASDSNPRTGKPGAASASDRASEVSGAGAGGEGGGGSNQTNPKKPPALLMWKPSPVRSLLGELDWQTGFRGQVSALTLSLLQSTDVMAQVGRRAVFWHTIELVRALLELGNSAQVTELVAAAVRPDGFLRRLEREDLRAVATKGETAVLGSMPGGSPIHGPALREALLLGPVKSANPPPDSGGDTLAVVAPPEKYYPPPWRCVEDKDDDGMPRRSGRAWRPSGQPSLAGPRRSRSRMLMDLDERKDDGDVICALVRALSRTPGNDAMWNLLHRVTTERGVEASDGGFHGEQVEALVSRHRERTQGLMYRGHDAAVWNRSKPALRLYSQAHATRPEEPLPMLCLATLIIRMVTVMETMMEQDSMCVLQGLACLHRYAELRRDFSLTNEAGASAASSCSTVAAIPGAVLEQEILYNLGRGYHQVGLAELAMEYYNKALRVEDERGHELRNWHGGDGVTKETAHNLCQLYKRHGATAMALRTLNKYLTVG